MAKASLKTVQIVMGSQSDFETMSEASAALKLFKIPHEMRILSAHRTPDEMADFAKKASASGAKVIIAGAGGAAHLPGMIASHTELPVIGVPVPIGPLRGDDALLSIVQMPKGIPVATVAIGNAFNAGLLAAQILGTNSAGLQAQLRSYKESLRKKVKAMRLIKKPRP